MKNIKNLLYISLFLLFACSNEEEKPINNSGSNLSFKIAVFSDPHYFDPDLGDPGEAYDLAAANSRKMIKYSEQILNSAINLFLESQAEIIIIPGDLTKDGEKTSHLKFADMIRKLKNAGKHVFVVPGNHDVANPEAYGYSATDKYKTESVSPQEIKQIYNDFGYSEALYQDENSLSYIAEPIKGLWIVGMDACRYRDNTAESHTVGGRFDQRTLIWLEDLLKKGKSEGKLMLGILHHGILEHFAGQKVNPVTSEFVIDDYKQISEMFAKNDMKFVFTGHFHANDIVSEQFGNNFLYDIETGSLLTYPVPVRFINVTNSERMDVSTAYIDNVAIDTKGMTFQNYAKDFITNDLDNYVAELLTAQFQLDSTIASDFASIGVQAFLSHYRGDEIITSDAIDIINKYSNSQEITVMLLSGVIQSLYTDLNPADNNISIDMKTGKILK
ncbi:MAG: metallophosphoesterase [Candidatus Kapabacteria bacterium]|nr:metallophosphoesterase [Ignavibacteriota bacterium]MCW5885710.1 metallophosphoesterase [Candidatus Kapabacteria bacterium]